MSEDTQDKHKELTQALHEIIAQNLTVGVYDDPDHEGDLNDNHIDASRTASQASLRRRGSVSYSQPSTPKRSRSFSPVSSDLSSLSDLSTEFNEDSNSESCASLNSLNSVGSTPTNEAVHNDFTIEHDTIHEHGIIHINDDETSEASKDITLKVPKHIRKKHKSRSRAKLKKKKKHALCRRQSVSYESSRSRSSTKSAVTPKKKGHKRSRSSAAQSVLVVRRNSKDCLDISAMSRLATKSIELWAVSEVCAWLRLIDNGKYREHAPTFKARRVDGRKLYKLNRSALQSLGVYHPAARKAILAALQRMKTKVRQTERRKVELYAKQHSKTSKCSKSVDSSPSKKQRGRGSATTSKAEANYVVAVKKVGAVGAIENVSSEKSKTLLPFKPLVASKSVPRPDSPRRSRADSQPIDEFLNEWDIRHASREPAEPVNFIGSVILQQTSTFTMIELSDKRVVYAVTAQVHDWTNADVLAWLQSVSRGRFSRFVPKFRERKTNGYDLVNISRVTLKNIGMLDHKLRSALLCEIKALKLATHPPRSASTKHKKRRSALSAKDIESARSDRNRKKGLRGHHRKSASVTVLDGSSFKSRKSLKSRSAGAKTFGIVPRKLGPRDIGRASYQGTKYDRHLFEGNFMEEKLDFKVCSGAFEKRKIKNPVEHRRCIEEIGIMEDFSRPDYADDALNSARKGQWLADRPLATRNARLDKLKGAKLERSLGVDELSAHPVGWKGIAYDLKADDGRAFLEEHFWFDGSAVQFNGNKDFSRMLNCLPPEKQMRLNKMPTPTGYESKLNWLRTLLKVVDEERRIVEREDAMAAAAERMELAKLQQAQTSEVAKQQVVVEVEGCEGVEGIEGIEEETVQEVDDVSSPEMGVLDVTRLTVPGLPAVDGSNSSSGSGSESNSDSAYSSSDSMLSRRRKYKRQRSRADIALGLASVPMTPRTMRKMSRKDMNRRRFFSQESVKDLQAMIANIEKSKTAGGAAK